MRAKPIAATTARRLAVGQIEGRRDFRDVRDAIARLRIKDTLAAAQGA